MKIVSFPPFDLDRGLHLLSHHLSSNTSTPNETKRIRNEKGGTASGKTTVVEEICQRLHDQCVVMLSQDSFYRGLTEAELENVGAYNFDVPSAFDVAAMVDCLLPNSSPPPLSPPACPRPRWRAWDSTEDSMISFEERTLPLNPRMHTHGHLLPTHPQQHQQRPRPQQHQQQPTPAATPEATPEEQE